MIAQTTIESVFSARTLQVNSADENEMNLVIHSGDAQIGITVRNADLLKALDAIPRPKRSGKPTLVETRIEHWKNRAEAAEAKLDRIIARVESSPSQYLKFQLQKCLDDRRTIVLTETIEGLKVGNSAFVRGTIANVLAADAQRLIDAGLAERKDA